MMGFEATTSCMARKSKETTSDDGSYPEGR
jgi:hypothetical protein